MKESIKTFPHFVSEKYGRLLEEKGKAEAFRLYSLEVESWSGKIEKELGEAIKFNRLCSDCHLSGKPCKDPDPDCAALKKLKEILGE